MPVQYHVHVHNVRYSYTCTLYNVHVHVIITVHTSPPLPCIRFSNITIVRANNAIMRPCPASPNMTAKRNGNVMTVYKAIGKERRMMDITGLDTRTVHVWEL